MPVNPNSLKNLRRLPKGSPPFAVSPGRPRTASLAQLIRDKFDDDPEGNLQILKQERPDLWFAYGFGKPAETINVGGIAGQPIEINSVESLTIPELKARLAALRAKGEA